MIINSRKSPVRRELRLLNLVHRINVHYQALMLILYDSELESVTFNGEVDQTTSNFMPIPQLFRVDGDITLVFLSGNGVYFDQRVDDEWYQGTVPDISLYSTSSNNLNISQGTVYRAAEAASPLGCVSQYQWCNNAYPGNTGCGPLAGLNDSLAGAAPYFNITQDGLNAVRPYSTTSAGQRFIWLLMLQYSAVAKPLYLLEELGARSLASQDLLEGGVQHVLPPNQWQIDVTKWWNISLARMQLAYVNTAARASVGVPAMIPVNAEEQHLCNSQVCLSQTKLG